MKKFKVVLAVTLAVLMSLALAPASLADVEATVLYEYAEIVEIIDEDDSCFVLVTNSSNQSYYLVINDDTVFLDNEIKAATDIGALEEGDLIIAYYSAVSTRSEPPQTVCYAIITNLKEGVDHAKFMTVGEIIEDESGLPKFLNTLGDYIITLPAGGPAVEPGDDVFVWFTIAAMSYPAQAQANAALVVGSEAAAVPPIAGVELVARPTSATVIVNGEEVSFDAYNILGNNFFKLRDLAYVLSGTEKQFGVDFDLDSNTILLTHEEEYTEVGGEMAGKGTDNKTPRSTASRILLDGEEVSFTAYNIEGNNYFMLRDIAATFDFSVEWDAENTTIIIDTSAGYTAE